MGDVQPIMPPAARRDALVLSKLTDAWQTEAELYAATGLTMAAMRTSVRRLWRDGKAMRRPAIGGPAPEWKRI